VTCKLPKKRPVMRDTGGGSGFITVLVGSQYISDGLKSRDKIAGP
jgi:hypothetical protein